MAQFKNTTIDSTGFIQLPVGTSGQRPGSAQSGQIRYNSTNSLVEWYDSDYTAWFPIDSIPPIATGGTVTNITQGGVNYRVHTFTSVGNTNFVVTRSGPVEFLIVAGGGGGGGSKSVTTGNWYSGSGGGAGGVLSGTVLVIPKTYIVRVGDGGIGAVDNVDLQAGDGEPSSALGFTATGGAGGITCRAFQQGLQYYKADGGSGAGHDGQSADVASDSGRPGNGTPGQGHRGGGAFQNECSGGGGGAGGPGMFSGPQGSAAGKGGHGIASDISGTLNYYGGGGGGGIRIGAGNYPAPGGIGGGGAGGADSGSNTPGTAGTTNTGGGAGGTSTNNGTDSNRTQGSKGGSGIVIIRYRTS